MKSLKRLLLSAALLLSFVGAAFAQSAPPAFQQTGQRLDVSTAVDVNAFGVQQ